MNSVDFEKEFSEWVFILDAMPTTPLSTSPSSSISPQVSVSPQRHMSYRDLVSSANVNGEIIFLLPERIILSVLKYSSTNPYALYRTVSLVCRQFCILAKKLPLQLTIRSTILQRLPDCKIVNLTVTTPISSEVIRLIGLRYADTLRVLKITQLNTTRETTLNEDSLLPLGKLTKLRQLALAWKPSPAMTPKAFSFISLLINLRKLSLEIYEKESNQISRTLRDVDVPLLSYSIPPQDIYNHAIPSPHSPYYNIAPLFNSVRNISKIPTSLATSSRSSLSSPRTRLDSPPALQQPQASRTTIQSPPLSPLVSPTVSPESFATTATSSQTRTAIEPGDIPVRANSAGTQHTIIDPNSKRNKMIQSSPTQHVKLVQTISTAGTHNPSISFLKIVTDLIHLEELKLSNWRDFGPLFLLASMTKMTTITIKGRPNDLMTDGASVADASRHFLFLATLQALRSLTLAWIPPCLPQLTRLSTLDLSQAPNLDDKCVAEFSQHLTNLTALSLDGAASGGLLTNAGVSCLSVLQNLYFLDVSHNPAVSEEAFLTSSWPLADLRMNHTSVASLKALAKFSATLFHLHVHSCDKLAVDEVGNHLRLLPNLITFRFTNSAISATIGIDEKLLAGYLNCQNIVCLCGSVVASPRSISILPGLCNLQFLELSSDIHLSRQSELFEPLGQMNALQSLVLTGIPLNNSIINRLTLLPSLASITASKVDESMSPKAILKLSSLNFLSIQLSSSSVADRWIRYVVRLPDLVYYSDGLQHPGDLPWATSRRLYLEWHPRAFKTNRTNNCTIS